MKYHLYFQKYRKENGTNDTGSPGAYREILI